MKHRMFIGCLPMLLLGACTTSSPEQLEAERASCEQMEQNMALRTAHDHPAMKGQGPNPMNLTHERCQQLLSRPKQ